MLYSTESMPIVPIEHGHARVTNPARSKSGILAFKANTLSRAKAVFFTAIAQASKKAML